jgi:hypothetical protein
MIQINLIADIKAPTLKSLAPVVKKEKKEKVVKTSTSTDSNETSILKPVLMAVAAVWVLIGGLIWHFDLTNKLSSITQMVIPSSSNPEFGEIKPVSNQNNKVASITPDVIAPVARPPKAKPTNYEELLPWEKIAYQRKMVLTNLEEIKKVTPASVGFVDLVFQVPGYFFAHGMASNPQIAEQFINNIAKISLRNESQPLKKVGIVDEAQEFSVHGEFNQTMDYNVRFAGLVPEAQVDSILSQLQALSQGNHAELKRLKKLSTTTHGLYKRHVYQGQTEVEFDKVLGFIRALEANPVRVGILQLSMKPNVDESLVSVFDFVVYSDVN